jgi:hypothetical protein
LAIEPNNALALTRASRTLRSLASATFGALPLSVQPQVGLHVEALCPAADQDEKTGQFSIARGIGRLAPEEDRRHSGQ